MDRQSEIQTKTATCPEHGEYEAKQILLMGKSFGWSKCAECNRIESERMDAERRASDEQERQRRLEARLSRAGIPLRFRAKTFATFTAATGAQAKALEAATEFANDFDQRYRAGATMVFAGKPGTGKSHLAIAIGMHLMAAGRTAMYLNALDAIRLVRSTWRRDSERTESSVMDDLATVDLLVLDEVGAQYGTEGEQVIMFDIINRRYQDQMPMILLTNHGQEGFKQYLGDRAFDRLREAGKWIAFDWASHRGGAA